MREYPYKQFPPRQFWSKSRIGRNDFSGIANLPSPLIASDDRIASAGSCFAANLVPFLEKNNFRYIRTEYLNPIYGEVPPENLGYAAFSAGYGNIYTARQLLQLLLRCLKRFQLEEDRWVTEKGVFDPFRPGLRYHALCQKEFELLREKHFEACLKAFSKCSVFIFTLGLTEAWRSRKDGAVFPVCPGAITGTFDAAKHEFVNFSVQEITDDMLAFLRLLRELNPSVKVILTVSPVSLVATATDNHVLPATVYSKSVLRVAAENICARADGVYYFPAYELACGPQAPDSFFDENKRDVTPECVEHIMRIFFDHCEISTVASDKEQKPPAAKAAQADVNNKAALISQGIVEYECEEAALDQ